MSNPTTFDISDHNYQQLEDKDEKASKTTIDLLLQKINSKTNKVQIQTLIISCIFFVFFGSIDLTIDFVFMSPSFKCQTNTKGKD